MKSKRNHQLFIITCLSIMSTCAASGQGDMFPPNSGTGGVPSPLAGTTNPATGTLWMTGDTYHLAFVSSTTTNMLERENIHFWNDYVNEVAAGSLLPGIPDLSWKVIGSDLTTHAHENAVVTAPVYLVDATTKIADGFAYMWNGSIDANLNQDESGNPGAGATRVWTGSNNNGTSAGNRSFNGLDNLARWGQRNVRDGRWISWGDATRDVPKHLYALSQPIQIVDPGAGTDTNPPMPEMMTWAEPPNGHTPTSIRMRSTLAYDLQSPPIEYFFTNTVTGTTRTWDTNRSWTETVPPYSQHTYRVKARDAAGNETDWSEPRTAVPLNLGPGGIAAPNGIHPVTGLPWQPGDIYQLAFVSSSLHTMTNRFNVHVWNDIVDDVADSSSLPGVPALSWKVIGSDRQIDARDNALVTSPVYLVDASSKVANGFDDLWSNFIHVPLNQDERGELGSGTSSVWTGSNGNGTSAGLRSFDHPLDNFVRRGERTQVNANWISRDDRARTQANHIYGLSQPIRITDGSPDNAPPVPAIMTWAQAPNGDTPTTIFMRATHAHDLDSPPVEYFFTNTVTQETRSWSENQTWTNSVAPNSLHTYMVKARDALGNETAFSTPYQATPLLQGPGGTAAPTGIHPVSGAPWQPGDVYHLAFLTSTETNMLSRSGIHFWNDYIQSVAEGSTLPGIPELNWKVIGSDVQTHARDNAMVTAPVYLVDATTKIANGFDDMWNNSIDERLDLDEFGDVGSGESRVWTGTNPNGTSAGIRSLNHPTENLVRTGERTQINSWWISRDDRTRSDNRRMYALSQPIRIAGGPADITPPSPNPMTFAVQPTGDSPTSIHMRATLAHDLDSPPVEYLFTNTVNGEVSGWQSEPDWIDGVPPGMANTYRVKARDNMGNETAWSDPVTSKPTLSGQNGVIAPTGVNPLTGQLWTDGDTYHLAFVSSTVDNLNTVRDIDGWNTYVNAIADGSSLPGVPETSWKIIGSTTNVHARDNALVTGPVYLLDGTTKIADSFDDMWDNRINAPLNLDENALPGSGSIDVWSGSTANGFSGNQFALNGTDSRAWRGHRTVVNNQWLGRDTQSRNQNRHFYALSEPLTVAFSAVNVVNGVADNFGADAANLGGIVYAPNGQTVDITVYWSTSDNADGAAWLADGNASSQVVGSFNNVSGQAISASVSGLNPDTVYYYAFRGVNADQEVWSTPNASFAIDTQPPGPNPMTFAVRPAANGPDEIRMTAATAIDALSPPVEYYFENVTAAVNSGWISESTHAFSGLNSDTMYDFRVRARDAVGNETAFSSTVSASTGIPWDGLVAYWSFDDADVSGTTLLDLADDLGAGKGDHDATLLRGVRPATDLPGDPDGGLTGNYYDANGNGYALVDTFSNGATDGDLEAGEQVTIAGWFRERPSGGDGVYLSKRGEDNMGWQLRRTGGGPQARFTLRNTSGPDDTPSLNIDNDSEGGPWYFMAASYTRDSDTEATLNFYGADSSATNKNLNLVSSQLHTPDIEAGMATNDFVALGAMSRGTIQRYSNSKMDEVAIWNRGLSQEEVTAWYGLSYFSGLKANDPAIQILLSGGVGTAVTGVGPHGHDWSRVNVSGVAGSITGSVAMADALIQITPSEALQLNTSGINDDIANTDDKTPIDIHVLNNDALDGGSGAAGDLEISMITQPVEGLVSINGGNQSLRFDPTGSALLRSLKPGESSVQTFSYTARNTTTAANASGMVTVTIHGLASITDGLVAYWTFDDADVSGQIALDLADDLGDGKGDHDATLAGGLRPASGLPGDPNGGLVGNYFNANGNDYGIVDTFANGAHHSDLDAGEQFTVAGWFRERPDGNEDALISKEGNSVGWDIRRNGGGSSIRTDIRNTSGADNPPAFNITADNDGGPWYFIASSYTKESDTFSRHRLYAADSGAAAKGLYQIGASVAHSTDNDVSTTGSMVVFGGRDNSNADTSPPVIDRQSNVKMDDIAFWNRGLSQEELSAWYGLSYFSGLKANDPAIKALLDGAVGTTVNGVGPHGHNWTRISHIGTAGDLSGSVSNVNALIQITTEEALQLSLSNVVSDDTATTDEKNAIVLAVLINDQLDNATGNSGDLEITTVTQPAEGTVSINPGNQNITFDPTESTTLRNLLVGQTSVQTFSYTARNINTLATDSGTVTITVTGIASFGDALVAHWTFDDTDVSGATAFDLADDSGFGKGDHDATLFGGLRPGDNLPGDPNGGLAGNYFDANGADYGVVDTFGGPADHSDLDAGEQFTMAGWFRERPSGNQARYISKNGEGTSGWDLRRNGTGNSAINYLRGTSGTANSPTFNIAAENDGGPWYFMAITYTRESAFYSTRQFYAADSEATNKGLYQVGNPTVHSPGNTVTPTGSMLVFGGTDSSDNTSNPPAIIGQGSVKMDDIAIWNRGLSHEEVTAWYGLSYFSGMKATNAAIQVLLDGPVGTAVSSVGPHGHNWTKITSNGTPGDLSGTVAGVDALIQITDSEALQLSLPDGVMDDAITTDEKTEISIAVLINDMIDGANASTGDLEISAVSQPDEGVVSIDTNSQTLKFDPSDSVVLQALLAGESSIQTFTYTARNTNTLNTDNGTVTVTITGLPSFEERLVAHWTFDDADVAGQTIFDIADNAGFGRGDHDATIMGTGITRPSTGLPGDPSGGLSGNFLNIESNAYAIVDMFGGAAQNNDLDAGEQFTVAGWFRELPDGNEELHISKYGDGNVGWDLRRPGNSARLRGHVRGSDGPDNTADFSIENNIDGGPWHFLALSYTRETEFYSTLRFFTANSEAVDKSLSPVGTPGIHSPNNDVADTDSLMVFGARDVSNNATTAPSIQRHGNTEMDDIAFWNRGLSHTELSAWYGLSYFSGIKATDPAIARLINGPIGTIAVGGPHTHNWQKILNNGAAGSISGTIAGGDARIQITDTEALSLTGNSPDNDNDGIPDNVDPDDDNDGMSDEDEAIAGTDDKDPDSVLYLLVEGTVDTSMRTLTFPSVLGRTYHIEGRESLDTGTWSTVVSGISGTGGMLQIPANDPTGRTYYRIGVINP